MFPTKALKILRPTKLKIVCRNPLKSGQCFLPVWLRRKKNNDLVRRNPLKSGQCFLLIQKLRDSYSGYKKSQSPQIGSMFPTLQSLSTTLQKLKVAIPSNRVNVSYVF